MSDNTQIIKSIQDTIRKIIAKIGENNDLTKTKRIMICCPFHKIRGFVPRNCT